MTKKPKNISLNNEEIEWFPCCGRCSPFLAEIMHFRQLFLGTFTALAKKTSARLREIAPSTVASSRNLANVFLANAVHQVISVDISQVSKCFCVQRPQIDVLAS